MCALLGAALLPNHKVHHPGVGEGGRKSHVELSVQSLGRAVLGVFVVAFEHARLLPLVSSVAVALSMTAVYGCPPTLAFPFMLPPEPR